MPRVRAGASPERFSATLHEELEFDSAPGSRRTAHTEGKMFGLTFWENWYVLGENKPNEPQFKFVYYTGKTLQNRTRRARCLASPSGRTGTSSARTSRTSRSSSSSTIRARRCRTAHGGQDVWPHLLGELVRPRREQAERAAVQVRLLYGQDAAEPHTEGKMFGLTFWENWYVLGENKPNEPQLKFVYYTGKTLQNRYEGAFVYSRQPELPRDAMPHIYRLARDAGMEPQSFCAIDNVCFNAPPAAGDATQRPLFTPVAQAAEGPSIVAQMSSAMPSGIQK